MILKDANILLQTLLNSCEQIEIEYVPQGWCVCVFIIIVVTFSLNARETFFIFFAIANWAFLQKV